MYVSSVYFNKYIQTLDPPMYSTFYPIFPSLVSNDYNPHFTTSYYNTKSFFFHWVDIKSIPLCCLNESFNYTIVKQNPLNKIEKMTNVVNIFKIVMAIIVIAAQKGKYNAYLILMINH
jgi:hypothetical protein